MNMPIVTDYYWIDDDFYVEYQDGTKMVFKKAYISSIKYEGLDYNNNENIALVGNNKE